MTRWLFLISVIFISSPGFGQNDSDLLVAKLEQFKHKNWDSVRYYANYIIEDMDSPQSRELGIAYKFLGDCEFTTTGNYDSALVYYDISLHYLELAKDTAYLSYLYNNYGAAYTRKGDFNNALKSFTNALEFTSVSSDPSALPRLLNNISEVNLFMKNYTEAEEYAQQGYALAAKVPDSMLIARSFHLLGLVESAKNEREKAIEYFKRAEKINAKIYGETISGSSLNIGREYHLNGEIDKAIPYYQKAVQNLLKRQLPDDRLSLAYLSLGEALLTLNRPDTANHIQKAIDIALKHKQKRVLLHAYEFLAWYDEAHDNYESALMHHKLFKQYSDSILNENSLEKLNSLNVKFKTAEKEQQITNQQLEIERQEAAILAERNQKIIIGSTLLFLILIGGAFYYRSRVQHRARLQAAVILEKEKGLKALFEATEKERQRISKDLHDGVGQQLSSIKMQLESLTIKDEAEQERKESITENLIQASQEVRQISHQMMPRSLAEEGLVPCLEDLFNKSFANTEINCSFEHHNVEQRFPEDIELSLYRITQELINNIIKHANAKNVAVQLYKVKNKLVMTVEDDGIGFDLAATGSGHGLLNIKSRIETVNGKVEYESSDKSETVITLSVPIT